MIVRDGSDVRAALEHADDSFLPEIKASFREMPGLTLTLPQACRLFHLREDQMSRAFQILIDEGFLKQLGSHRFAISE